MRCLGSLLAVLIASGPAWGQSNDAGPSGEASGEPASLTDVLAELGAASAVLADSAEAAPASDVADRLAATARTVAIYADLASGLAAANRPLDAGWHVGVEAGGGAEDRGALGGAFEVALSAGMFARGVSCPLFDASARVALTRPDAGDDHALGASLSQYGTICLEGISPTDDAAASDAATAPEQGLDITWIGARALAMTLFESAGWNVRAPIDQPAVVDSRAFSFAEAGLRVEGLRLFASPRTSVLGLEVAVRQRYLRREAGAARSVHQSVFEATFFEWRRHRPPAALGDATVKLLGFQADHIEAGDPVETIELWPLALGGIGIGSLAVDASGGLRFTNDLVVGSPDAYAWTYRLALRAGAPDASAGLVGQRRLIAMVNGDAVIEDRIAATARLDRPWLSARAEAFRAHNRLYADGDGRVDRRYLTWGVDAEFAVPLAGGVTAGGLLEVGRAAAFAPPATDPAAPARPDLGFRVLARASWTVGRLETIEP